MSEKIRIALYIRISVEDEDNHKNGKDESNSIGNQRDLLHRYLENKQELKASQIIELCDEGFTGTNFQRPAVTELLEKAKSKEIDCIIVKDFSRFGRSYIDVSDYIDQIFPFLGIRFISVNDGYDSADANGATSSVDVAFRNIIYGYYSEDLSKKVKTAMKTKAEKGEFVTSRAPFGYRKSKSNKSELVADEDSAHVVKRIFHMACTGMKPLQIAKVFNAENIETPLKLKNRQGVYRSRTDIGAKGLWAKGTVEKIIRDEQYLGKAIYGKRSRTKVGSHEVSRSSKSNWIVVEGKHEPLVSLEDFKEAQLVMADYKEIGKRKEKINLLSGKLKCGVCGYSLLRRESHNPRYSCDTRNRVGEYGCMKGHIRESEILEVLLSAIRTYAAITMDEQKMMKTTKRCDEPFNIQKQLEEYQTTIRNVEEQKAMLYDDYAEGKTNREYFKNERNHLTKRQEEMEICIGELQNQLAKEKDIISAERTQQDRLKQYLKADMVTREVVIELVDNIFVYTDHSIKINWRFG